MNATIIIPHFKTGKMTAYTIAQILKYSQGHSISILISDNNSGDGSIKYLEPFKDHITVFDYPNDILQSHGNGYNMLMEKTDDEWTIALESDSFPTSNDWLDYYEEKINEGYDCAGSKLVLSGGTYIHPAGMLFRKSIWEEAKKYCEEIPYTYFPNMARSMGFNAHLMVRNDMLDKVLSNPDDYIELSDPYKKMDRAKMEGMAKYYSPVARGPLHQGMGGRQESIKTYGQRNIESDSPFIIMNNKAALITRIGYEPGQWFSYYQFATAKKVFVIPTKIEWLPGRENQNQAYTLTENGVKHLWGISAYHDSELEGYEDIIETKKQSVHDLYNSLPNEYKIDL